MVESDIKVQVISVSAEAVDVGGISAEQLPADVSAAGSAVVEVGGKTATVHFEVCTGNTYTGEQLSENTNICTFLTDATGNGDSPDLAYLRDALGLESDFDLVELRDAIEVALDKNQDVRDLRDEVKWARDEIIEAEERGLGEIECAG